MSSVETPVERENPDSAMRRAPWWRRIGIIPLCALAILIAMIAAAVFAPLIAPYNPNAPDLMAALQGPSAAHPLGTDALGRDTLSRLMFGGRTTLLGPVLVILLSTVLGLLLGVIAAWLGGAIDTTISRIVDVLFSIPGIVFALVTVAILGAGLWSVVIGLTIAYTPYAARVIRSGALRERRMPYISAAWIQGRSGATISRRHLIPNIRPLTLAQGVAALGFAVIDLASMSFLGLGVQPPSPDWGLMVKSGLDSAVRGQPTELIAASLAIALFVGAVTVVGDRLSTGVKQ